MPWSNQGGGTGTGWSGKVTNYAALPDATTNVNAVFLVQNSTGTFWGKKKGLYESDGATWTRLSNATFQVLDSEAVFKDDIDETKQVIVPAERMLTGMTGTTQLDVGQTITVGVSGAMYTDPKTAIESISDSSIFKPYTVEIFPGNYTVDNPITVPPFVTIKGVGSVLIIASNPSNNVFSITGTCFIQFITVQGATSGHAFSINSTGNVVLTDVVVIDCNKGVDAEGVGLTLTVRGITFLTLSSTIAKGIDVRNGNVVIQDTTVGETSTVTQVIDVSVATTICTVDTFKSFSPNVTSGIKVNTATAILHNINIYNAYDGIEVGDGSSILVNALNIFDSQNDGFIINDVGANTIVQFQTVTAQNSGRYDMNILSATALASGNGRTSLDRLNFVAGAQMYGAVVDLKEGDEGFNVIGELHVGLPLAPAESVFGGGDSHTFEYVYTFDGTSTYTDKTAQAVSFSSSTLSLDGVTVGNALYIASRYPLTYGGIKVAIETAAVIGSGSIVAEYWNGAWTDFNGCTVEGNAPYLKYAKNYFDLTGDYHVKFNPFIIDDWVANDPITPAVGENLYWTRFRVVTDITTAPVFQQIKIHTNRTEINGDGTIEYHADGRTYKKLVVDAVKPVEGSMQSASIYVDENVGVGLEKNRFTTAGDLLGVSFELPEDCDTSAPLIFVWKGKFASTGDVNFTIRRKIVKPGDSYTNTEPGASGDVVTVTTGLVTISAADTREDLRVDIDISDAIPSRTASFGDEIWITIQMPIRGAGNFDYTKLSANYLSDFNGRHIRQ